MFLTIKKLLQTITYQQSESESESALKPQVIDFPIRPIVIEQRTGTFRSAYYVINDFDKSYWISTSNNFNKYNAATEFATAELAIKLYYAINNVIIKERKLESKPKTTKK